MAKPVFTIAISGCSSAGKSTLAFLLSEIFSDVEVDLNSKCLLSLSITAGSLLHVGLWMFCWKAGHSGHSRMAQAPFL